MPVSRSRQVARAAALSLTAMSLAGFQTADSPDRYVLIINATSQTMIQFYASNPRLSEWPEDILGGHVIPAGGSLRLNLADGSPQCVFDLRAMFSDGHYLEDAAVNVCEVPEHRFTELRRLSQDRP